MPARDREIRLAVDLAADAPFVRHGCFVCAVDTGPDGRLLATECARVDALLRGPGRGLPAILICPHDPAADPPRLDNADALRPLVRAHRVCLIVAAGAEDRDFEGVPCIGADGVRVAVGARRLRVLRAGRPPLEAPTTPSPRPGWRARVDIASGAARVRVDGGLPSRATLEARADGRVAALDRDAGGWSGSLAVDPVPGPVAVRVVASLPDGRRFAQTVRVDLSGPGAAAPAWRTDVAAGVVGAPASERLWVFVATGDGAVEARDRRDGALAWRAPIDGRGALGHCGGVLLAVPRSGAVVGCDPATGRMLWAAPGIGPDARLWDVDGVAVLAGRRSLVVLDPERGRTLWGADGVATGVADGVMVDGAPRDPRTGRRGARPALVPPPGAVLGMVSGVPAMVCADDGRLRCVDLRDGRVCWERPLDAAPEAIALGGALVAVADARGVLALHAASTGAPRGRIRHGLGRLSGAPRVDGGDVFASGVGGGLLRMPATLPGSVAIAFFRNR